MTDDKVLSTSALSFDSALDAWSQPSVNLGIKTIRFLKYKPINSYSAESSVRFHVPNNGSTYLYLPQTSLEVKFRIVYGDNKLIREDEAPEGREKRDAGGGSSAGRGAAGAGQDRPAAKPGGSSPGESAPNGFVGPVNFTLHSLFDTCELQLGGQTVTNISGYAFKAVVNTLLNTSESVKNTSLYSQMYAKDTAGCHDDVNPTFVGTNKGLTERYERCKNSKVVTLSGFIDVDFFNMQKYLANGISLTLILTNTSNAFRLLTAEEPTPDYRIEILDYTLIMAHVHPSPNALLATQELLSENSLLRYFYIKETFHRYSITSGVTNFFCENLFSNSIPQRMVIFFMASGAQTSSFKSNPYLFAHYGLTRLALTINGETAPGGIISTNFEQDDFSEAYSTIMRTNPQTLGRGMEVTNGITAKDYANGNFFVHLNLQPQSFMGSFFPLKSEGSTRLELRFSSPLPETIIMGVIAYTGSFVEVDYARNVFLAR